MFQPNQTAKAHYLQLAVAIAMGTVIGTSTAYFLLPKTLPSAMNDACNTNYSMLRRDLDCSKANEDYMRVSVIQDQLKTYIDSQKSNGSATRVSVFFRDLTSRRWATIDKDAQYAPGSLLKVPLAIAYYKLSEVEPQILDETFLYSPTSEDANNIENFKPEKRLIPGQKYTIDTLIEHMILYSDNEATVLLNTSIEQEFLSKVLTDLGIKLPQSGGGEQNFVTTEQYASILRSLYLASYLNIDNSQKLLTLLSKTSFSQGISSGVPDNIPVAHKFGERTVVNKATEKLENAELHDCGVVYKKDDPYVLCVMTEGTDYSKLTKILSDISKLVYYIE